MQVCSCNINAFLYCLSIGTPDVISIFHSIQDLDSQPVSNRKVSKAIASYIYTFKEWTENCSDLVYTIKLYTFTGENMFSSVQL